MRYPVVIHKDPDSDYSVTFPDLPGCFTAGESIEEALAMAVEAAELHIEGCLEEGIAVADPSPIAALRDSYAGGTWALVEIDWAKLSHRARRVNITLPEAVLDKIDHYAKARHMSRSAFLAKAAIEAMR